MPLLCLLLVIFLSQNVSAGEFGKDISAVKEDVMMFRLKESSEPIIYGSLLTGMSFFFDREIRKDINSSRSSTNKALSDTGNLIGNPYLSFFTPLSIYGFTEKESKLNRSSFRAAESVFFSTAIAGAISIATGRKRPENSKSPFEFNPFSFSHDSFPSKHMAASTALFTTYAKFYDNSYLYIFPVITAFGRLYENKHYLSDTLFGATIGYTVASYLYKREGLKKPSYLPLIMISKEKVMFALSFNY